MRLWRLIYAWDLDRVYEHDQDPKLPALRNLPANTGCRPAGIDS